MSTSLSFPNKTQDPADSHQQRGRGARQPAACPSYLFSRCAPLKSPFFRGSRLGFPSGSLAVCGILGMSCTRFCLPPPNQQASPPPRSDSSRASHKGIGRGSPWDPLEIGDLRTRRLHHCPNCRLQFARRRPNHPPSRNTFLIPSCGVRRTAVFCASHPSYEVVWLSAESGPQPAPSVLSPRREEGFLAGLAPIPQQQALHPASGASTQRPSSRLETVQRREKEGGAGRTTPY